MATGFDLNAQDFNKTTFSRNNFSSLQTQVERNEAKLTFKRTSLAVCNKNNLGRNKQLTRKKTSVPAMHRLLPALRESPS